MAADSRLAAGSSPADRVLRRSVPQDRHHEDTGYRAAGGAGHPDPVYGPAGADDDRVWAMMAYLGMIFFAFLPPLAVYLVKQNESGFVRYHAAQALNLWITAVLYSVSFVIIGGVLALDTVAAALAVSVPLITAAGIAMLSYAVLAALAASRGVMYRIPAWICVGFVK